jgi:histidinol phosphatase-like PHP family hydrolase
MHEELWAAIAEHGKAMEANIDFFYGSQPETFRRAYAEFIRGAFEKGVPITIGTDCHGPKYNDANDTCRDYLGSVGFKPSDFSKPRFRTRRAV